MQPDQMEKLSFSEAKKQGNSAFKSGNYEDAIAAYGKGIAAQENPIMNGPDDRDNAATLWSNTALAHAKAEQWGLSLRASECALLCDSCHSKATFRQATAYMRLGRGRAAVRAFKLGLSRIPKDDTEARGVWEAALSEANEVREREAQRMTERKDAIEAQDCGGEASSLSELVLRSVGFDPNDVAAEILGGYGRSIVAQRSLKAGDVLANVSREHTLSAATLAATRPEVAARMHSIQLDRRTRLAPQTELALLLMEQLHHMEDSPHAAYLASLPDHVATPLLFEPEALEALQDGQLADEVLWRHRSPLLSDWSKLCSTAFWLDPGSWDPTIFHLDGFLRSISLLSSRALPDSANQSSLIPGVDLLNTPSAAIAADATRGGSVELLHPGPGQTKLCLQHDVGIGEQIFLSYGTNKPNKSWMMHFGFVMPGNPAEQVEVDLYRDGSLSVYHEAIIRWLEASRSITLRLGFEFEQVEEEIWIGLWVAGLPTAAAKVAFEQLEAEQENGGDLEATRMKQLACGEELPAGWRRLAEALEEFLSSRPSSVEEDEAELGALSGLMDSSPMAASYEVENMATAIHYRLARKRVVADALVIVQARVQA